MNNLIDINILSKFFFLVKIRIKSSRFSEVSINWYGNDFLILNEFFVFINN